MSANINNSLRESLTRLVDAASALEKLLDRHFVAAEHSTEQSRLYNAIITGREALAHAEKNAHTRPLVELATLEARRRLRREDRDHPRADDLENYLSPCLEIEVFCTTQEREDFEMETDISFSADVIDRAEEFDRLVTFLAQDSYKLKRI